MGENGVAEIVVFEQEWSWLVYKCERPRVSGALWFTKLC